MKGVMKVLSVLCALVVLAGCQGRSVAEEENLVRGFEAIVEKPLSRYEKILKGELKVSSMDQSDIDQFMSEVAAAREFVQKELARKP